VYLDLDEAQKALGRMLHDSCSRPVPHGKGKYIEQQGREVLLEPLKYPYPDPDAKDEGEKRPFVL
jgi:hypothetical protein